MVSAVDHNIVPPSGSDAWQRYSSTLAVERACTTRREERCESDSTEEFLNRADMVDSIISSDTYPSVPVELVPPAGPSSHGLYLITPIEVSLKPIYPHSRIDPTPPLMTQIHNTGPSINKSPLLNKVKLKPFDPQSHTNPTPPFSTQSHNTNPSISISPLINLASTTPYLNPQTIR